MEIEKKNENRNVQVACVFCLTLVSTEDAQNIQGCLSCLIAIETHVN